MDLESNLDNILENLTNDDLNRAIWDDNDDLKPDVHNSLLKIAYDFAEKNNIPQTAIVDIIITGSLAGYTWTDFSDVDLHIVIDYNKIDASDEIAHDYFDTAKSLWGETHDIEICNHDVEVYVQGHDEPHVSPGVYSITKDLWLKPPVRTYEQMPSEMAIGRKAQRISNKINDLQQLFDQRRYADAVTYANQLKDYISNMRQAGLDRNGEMSVENQAFKALRNQGDLERLSDLKINAYDRFLSITNCPS